MRNLQNIIVTDFVIFKYGLNFFSVLSIKFQTILYIILVNIQFKLNSLCACFLWG